ncbi:hypothetical protein GWI33_020348 [Rhynchophorus ferrugineus]|uniref:Uncharacterized protein n=1 Tax=Rhynchophorus ferrugineus TaxID=354439 RepID=A0A834HWL4_RHYFE|nr:hypothetical protein GWI33_020348 [Rhynchophorus ferrugineus]
MREEWQSDQSALFLWYIRLKGGREERQNREKARQAGAPVFRGWRFQWSRISKLMCPFWFNIPLKSPPSAKRGGIWEVRDASDSNERPVVGTVLLL